MRRPEGPRFLRSDGTPPKLTRVHKEQRWLDEARELEVIHTPATPFRAALLEMLNRNVLNVIVGDGVKYLGLVTLPKLASEVALWEKKDEPIYKVLLEPLKRALMNARPLTLDMGDKEVREVLEQAPPSDEYPIVQGDKAVGILPLREVVAKRPCEAALGSIAKPVPVAKDLNEALKVMYETSSPVVSIEDRVLDSRDLAKRIWEERTLEVGQLSLNDLPHEPYEVFKENVKLSEAVESLDIHRVDYVLVKGEGGLAYVPINVAAACSLR